MKQLTQNEFKKGAKGYENIASPQQDAEHEQIKFMAVDEFGNLQYSQNGTLYKTINTDSSVRPLKSLTVVNDPSLLPSGSAGDGYAVLTNGNLPLYYYIYTTEWENKGEMLDNSLVFYDGLIYICSYTATGFFVKTSYTKTSELTNDAQFVDSTALAAVQSQVDNKVDKTTSHSQLYATNSDGEQTTISYADASFLPSIYAYTIVQRSFNGQIYVPTTPTLDGHAASKKYVDTGLSGKQETLDANQLAAVNSGATTTNIGQIATNTNDIATLQTAVSGKQNIIDATHKLNADYVDDSTATNKFVTASEKSQISSNASNITSLQSNKVDKTTSTNQLYGTDNNGNQATYTIGTNAGNIPKYDSGKKIQSVTPVNGDDVANKDYVDTGLGNKQDTISASNKVDADYIDDMSSTNKFVTSSDISTWNGKQDALTFDTAPTASSTNPVESGGVYTALSGKQAALSSTQLDAVNSGIDSTKVGQIATNTTNIGTNAGAIATINGKIPNEATATNQLADKAFVNSSINAFAAYYITKNAQGDPFATKAELTSATTFYSGGSTRTPTTNDYCIVLADESKQSSTGVDPTTRYTYQVNQWEYQYTINDTPLTSAQLNAINSGITSSLVTQIGTNQTDISTLSSNKADKSATVSTVTYDTTNKKLTKTINGTTTDVVSTATLKFDMGLATVATSGAYSDLSGTPTKTSDFTNDGDGVSNFATLADLPTVNNATLTIQKNSTNVATFTANASSNVTANISVPTSDSDLTNNRYIRYDINNQGLSDAEKANARANIDAASASATSVLIDGVAQSSVSFTSDPQTQINAKQNTIDSSHKLSADLVEDGSTNKVFTATEQTKLSGIEAGAQVNDLEGVQINGTDLTISSKKVNIVTNTAYNATSNKIATMSDLPANITITTTSGSESVSDGTNTLSFGANAFNSTTIPTTYVSSVNGSSGAITGIVDTTSSQTLSNKTLSGVNNTGDYNIGSSNSTLASVTGTALTLGDTSLSVDIAGSSTRPTYNSNSLALYNDLPTSINGMSGGTLTSTMYLTGGSAADKANIQLDRTANGQLVDNDFYTIFGFRNNETNNLYVGRNTYGLKLRGSGTRPQFNGNDLALKSDVPSSGGWKTPTINTTNWEANSINYCVYGKIVVVTVRGKPTSSLADNQGTIATGLPAPDLTNLYRGELIMSLPSHSNNHAYNFRVQVTSNGTLETLYTSASDFVNDEFNTQFVYIKA